MHDSHGVAPTLDHPDSAETWGRGNAPPGSVEKLLAGIVLAVFLVGLPTKWGFQARGADPSNPLLTLARLVLPGLLLMRVAGNIDAVIGAIRRNSYPFAFSFLALGSIFWSDDPAISLEKGLELVMATSFAYYLILRFGPRGFLRLAITTGLVVTLLHLAFVLGLPSRGQSPAGFNGLHLQKNALGRDSGIQIMLLMFGSRAFPSQRPIYYVAILANLFLLVGTTSMTSILALGLTLGLWPVFYAFRARRTMPGVVLFGLLGAGALALSVVTVNLGRLTAALGKDITFTGRTAIWQESIPIAAQRPVLGWGFEAAFTGYFGPLHEPFIVAGWQASHAHNALLQVFLELGLAGVALYAAFYFRSFRSAIRLAGAQRSGLGLFPLVILTYGVMISLTEIGPQSSPYAWVLTVYVGVLATHAAVGVAPVSRLKQTRSVPIPRHD